MKNLLTIIFFALPLTMTAQTKNEVLAELKRQRVPHAGIVLAQARLETGNFKSALCRKHHNLFGIKRGRSYAHYATWQQSVADYKKRISSRYKGGDYYAFLQRIGYAEDGKYISKLKSF